MTDTEDCNILAFARRKIGAHAQQDSRPCAAQAALMLNRTPGSSGGGLAALGARRNAIDLPPGALGLREKHWLRGAGPTPERSAPLAQMAVRV